MDVVDNDERIAGSNVDFRERRDLAKYPSGLRIVLKNRLQVGGLLKTEVDYLLIFGLGEVAEEPGLADSSRPENKQWFVEFVALPVD